MELKLNKEPVYLSEVIYDGQAEQGVEFDYVLPDYYPDIFKILKCTLTPCIVSYSISGSQLFCDGVVYIKVMYLAAESNRINCIEQRYTYSKTIDLVKNADNAVVYITPKTDYCNCRAVSGRRIDVRGAVSCKVKVICNRKTEMLSGANGSGIETKRTSLTYCGEKLSASHQFVSREDIETGAAKSGNISIIHSDTSVAVSDFKVIANKVVVKGEVQLKALYITERTDNGETDDTGSINAEVMEAVIPVSQIVDLEGVTEKHICFINLTVMDCDLEVKPSDAGESRIFTCDMTLNCNVTAHLESSVSPLIDLYSTDFETNFTVSTIKAESIPQIISQQLNVKSSVESQDGNLAAVFDARCDIINVICRARGSNEFVLTGQANMQIIGKLDTGAPVFIEKAEPFELVTSLEVPDLGTEHNIEPNLQVTHVAYSIASDNHVDIRINLSFTGCLYTVNSLTVIRDISVNEDKPKDRKSDFALKLYFAEEREEIWGIAKRYNTSAEAIITENDLESDKVEAPCMLLIPIV